jgi:GPH family glycoside/pentoside/hexuronide:cation symporter
MQPPHPSAPAAPPVAEPTSPPPAARERLPLGRVLAYGLPIVGLSYPIFFVQFYFLKFATDVLLLPPATIGLLFGLGRVWDAVSDPLAGYWSDRTRTRLGRRRPWMLAALPLLVLSFAMLWRPPESFAAGTTIAWCGLALFAFYTAFTLYVIPHQSLGAELSLDYHERSRVFGTRHVAFVTGMMLAFGAMHVLRTAESPRSATGLLAVASVLVAAALALVPVLLLRERPEFQGRGAGSPYRALVDVARNSHARVLLLVWFVESLGGGVLGVLAPFIVEYVIGRPDLIAVVPAVFVVCAVASVPIWISLSRRFGKRDVWRAAQVGMALSFGATFFVGRGDVALMCALMVVAGSATGCGGAIGASMLADVIDYDEYRSGDRKEGAYSAAWGFSLKIGIGLVIMLTGLALQLSGFEPGVEQSPAAERTLRGLFAGLPFFAYLTAALLFGRFRLGRDEHARIRSELDRRGARGGRP